MNLTVGETIKEYKVLELIGESDLENYYSARHLHFDTPAHVRELKPQHLGDAGLRTRYLSALLGEMRDARLERDIHYFLVNDRGRCCLIRNLDVVGEGQDHQAGVAAPPPNAGVLGAFHDQVQLLARVSLPVGVLAALTLLGWTVYLSLDGLWLLPASLALLGLGFGCIGLGAVGLLEQRRWGQQLTKVGHYVVLGSAPLFILLVEIWSRSLDTEHWKLIRDIGVIAILFLASPPILALVIMYSKKAKYYFR